MDIKKDIKKLIMAKKPKVGRVRFIAIDGHGGSGKSTLAKLLSDKLGAEIIHTDDFASPGNSKNWWPLLIEPVFEPVANGAQLLSYQPSKWWENHHPAPVVDQPVTDIMILEGVSSLRDEFREYVSFGIFVDTPRDICLRRGVERDKVTGKSEEELTKLWDKWLANEEDYMARDNPKVYADIVLKGDKPFSDVVD